MMIKKNKGIYKLYHSVVVDFGLVSKLLGNGASPSRLADPELSGATNIRNNYLIKPNI